MTHLLVAGPRNSDLVYLWSCVNHALNDETRVRTLRGYCSALRLELRRADSIRQERNQKEVQAKIRAEIARADGVVFDLTNNNPNVLYELGVADQANKPVFLARSNKAAKKVCFDIKSRHIEVYKSMEDASSVRALIERFDKWLRDHEIAHPPPLLKGDKKRAIAIADALESALNQPPRSSHEPTVRFSGGSSPFSISQKEIARLKKAAPKYGRSLERERDAIHALAQNGHRIRCLINVPSPDDRHQPSGRHRARYRELARALRDTSDPLKNIEWAIVDYLPPSTYIIDKSSVFEGYRKTREEGYKLTLRSTSEQEIRARTELFDSLFATAEHWSRRKLCKRLDRAGSSK